MQVIADQVIDVVPVRHRGVATIGAVHVSFGVPAAAVFGRALAGIRRRGRQSMLVVVLPARVMQVPLVQVIDVPLVLHRQVPTTGAMAMRMLPVPLVFGHLDSFPGSRMARGGARASDPRRVRGVAAAATHSLHRARVALDEPAATQDHPPRPS
jgi:hypothetical protein